jgi:hypothetical protein
MNMNECMRPSSMCVHVVLRHIGKNKVNTSQQKTASLQAEVQTDDTAVALTAQVAQQLQHTGRAASYKPADSPAGGQSMYCFHQATGMVC